MPKEPRRKPRAPGLPKLCRHAQRNLAFVDLCGRRIYIGPFSFPEAREAYDRALAEWLANGRRLPAPPEDISVAEVLAAYVEYVDRRCRNPDGTPSAEAVAIKHALSAVAPLYSALPAVRFGPRALKAVRRTLLDGTAPRSRGRGLCRSGVNGAICRIKHAFK